MTKKATFYTSFKYCPKCKKFINNEWIDYCPHCGEIFDIPTINRPTRRQGQQ